jgi:SAM-dependent methyltransferase
MPEAVTKSFSTMSRIFKHVTGSEYLGGDHVCGKNYVINGVDIVHQDLTKLSFDDEQFNIVISQEVFEHIPDYNKSFQECYRVLAEGGKLIFTVPFFWNNDKTEIIAHYNSQGIIVTHDGEPPEIHGNPVGDGAVCFQHFSWDILDDLRTCGFIEVYAYTYSSVLNGHYSDYHPGFVFYAKKCRQGDEATSYVGGALS